MNNAWTYRKVWHSRPICARQSNATYLFENSPTAQMHILFSIGDKVPCRRQLVFGPHLPIKSSIDIVPPSYQNRLISGLCWFSIRPDLCYRADNNSILMSLAAYTDLYRAEASAIDAISLAIERNCRKDWIRAKKKKKDESDCPYRRFFNLLRLSTFHAKKNVSSLTRESIRI